MIVDHCSVSWGTDETLSIIGAATNVTVQWCINAEGLDTPQVHKSRAALIKFTRAVSYHHNLMAHFVAARNPRLQGHVGTIKDVVNNVVYNFRSKGHESRGATTVDYIGNYLKKELGMSYKKVR